MSYGSNLQGKDNLSWSISNVTETRYIPCSRLRFACAIGAAWLIGLPRRAGRRLHATTDTESQWWHWYLAERHGGLTHQYRDARFADLCHDPTLRRPAQVSPVPVGCQPSARTRRTDSD